MKIVTIDGIKIKASTLVVAPKKRIDSRKGTTVGFLPCYDKSICQIEHCSKYDTVEYVSKMIIRQPCDEDCPKRINIDPVRIRVCKHCSYIKVQAGIPIHHIPPAINCMKYIEESKNVGKRMPYGRETRIFRRGGIGDNWYGGHKV